MGESIQERERFVKREIGVFLKIMPFARCNDNGIAFYFVNKPVFFGDSS
jgi:hypothetical protein